MLFHLGRTVATRGALSAAEENNIDLFKMLLRHGSGDYGNLDQEDIQANVDAISYGARILSKYVEQGISFYVITEASRDVTTVLLVDEY